MGNWCIDVCNNLNNTIRGPKGNEQKSAKGGKKGKFVDFRIGVATISKDEFKQAAKKRKEEQRKLELIDKMHEQDIERRLKMELEKIKQRQLEKRYRGKDFKYFDDATQQRIYNFSQLDKDELLQQVLGYSSLRMLNEKQCEPLAFFPLKNSDELLWEDHSEYLQNVVLDELIQLDECETHKSLLWEGKRLQNLKQQYLVEITQIKNNEYLQSFEENFYYNKTIQQLLSLTKQETIASDIYNVSYQQQWFLLIYSNIFLRVTDKPVATLREIIQMRSQLPKTEGQYKQQEILGFLILMMRALRDAKSINIDHGNVNDENIYLSGDGSYKIKGFNELRIGRYQKKNTSSQSKKDINKPKSPNQSDFEESIEINDQYDDEEEGELQEGKYHLSCTYSYLKYYIKQVKPRHLMFYNETIRPVIEKGLNLYQENKIEEVNELLGKERLIRNTEEVYVNSILMQQNFHSLAIIAIQMISLGKFEQWCNKHSKSSTHSNQNKDEKDISQASKYIKSFCGLHTDDFYLKRRAMNPERFKEYQHKTYIEIMSFLAQYQIINSNSQNYQIVILYIQDMLKPNCDWKRIMDQLQEEEFDPPNDLKLFMTQYEKNKNEKPKTELENIIEWEENKNGLLNRAFNVQDTFITLRNYYYQIQGYMLIRNTRVGQEAVKQIFKDIEKLNIKDQNKLNHYKINHVHEIFFSKTEYAFVKFCLGFFYMQNRELQLALETFQSLELDLAIVDAKTLKKFNGSNSKFYQGLITFISGEAEDALLLFNRVSQLQKDNLQYTNEKAYYQFIHYYFLLQLDQDGYFQAFKYIQQLNEYHEQQCQKYDYISKSLILSCYNRGKAYYEVSQFELSKYYFDISLKLIQNITRSGSEMDSLRLLNLGYLSYLHFLTNDMESMKINLSKAMSIMQEALSSFHCLETVVIWFNFFGFLLKSLYTDLDDMNQQIELFQLTIDNNKKVKIDQFFKKFVFGKMFYYSGDMKRSQELFLDAVQLQQYHVADELRIKQTQNISAYQMKEFQQQKIQMLKDYQEQQKKYKTTLPPPEKDNLTVRLLMEVYDWLGYIYMKQNQDKKAMLCYNLYQQYMYNLFRFEQTLIDEYTMRWAKIQFYLKNYDESLRLFSQLSCDLRKQDVDEELYFEYQQIQSEISRWMGLLYMLQNKDAAAKVSYLKSREELMKLCKEQQVAEVKAKTQISSRLHTNTSNPKFLSQEKEEDVGQSSQVGQSQYQTQNKIEYVNFSMIQLQITRKNIKELQYFQLQQAPILILIIQNYTRIIWDFIALNLKKQAINYVEEFLDFIEKDKYLKSEIFKNILKDSIRSDVYFLIGYLYGLRGQHEETFIFLKRTFVIIKELYENNQLDQQLIIKMSLIYDQMSRVLANQGFFIYARQYLMNSLQLFQQVKKKTNPLQIAYKHANLGNLLYKLGQYTDARIHTESALIIFEEEYGKVSVPVLQVRTKLLEILLVHNTSSNLVRKATLQLIETFKIVCETEYSTQLDGQIDRMVGSYHHKYGNYVDAMNSYLASFIKLLDDNEAAMKLLNLLSQQQQNPIDLLNIKSSDRASMDVALKIAQLYIDNLQYEEAFDLLTKLLKLSQGIDYDPPELGKISVFGHDKDEEIHTNTEGVLRIISCFNKTDFKKGNLTLFEVKRQEIFDKLKSKRHINILFIADIYKMLGMILNFWERQRFEPYYFITYPELLKKYYGTQSKFQGDKQHLKIIRGQEIDNFQANIYDFLLDALIIYQESIGDYHISFVETLYLLSERQYLLQEYEDLSKQATQVIGLLKQKKFTFPIKKWRLSLVQIKTNLQNCRVYKQLNQIINRFNLDPGVRENENLDEKVLKEGQLAIIKILRSEEEDFAFFMENFNNYTEDQKATRLMMEINLVKSQNQLREQGESIKIGESIMKNSSQLLKRSKSIKDTTPKYNKESFKERIIVDKDLLQQQQRVLDEASRGLTQIEKQIARYENRKNKFQEKQSNSRKSRAYLEGNQNIIQFELKGLKFEISQIRDLIKNILGNSQKTLKEDDD